MTFDMTEEDTNLDDEIDQLAEEIEMQIASNEEYLENAPEFDSKHRRMQEAKVDTEELFA